MRAAELAGLDAGGVLAAAIGERDLAGARDLAAVLDARLRYRIGSLVPAAASSWSAHVPAIADSERRAFAVQITALMDARKDRIGEHAADHACLGRSRRWARCPRMRWTGWTGRNGLPRSAPGGNCPGTVIPAIRLALSVSRPPRTSARPGKRPPLPSVLRPARCVWHARRQAAALRDTCPIEAARAPQYGGDEQRSMPAALTA
jgi:hypothetical protein